jgi:hypothetical protein
MKNATAGNKATKFGTGILAVALSNLALGPVTERPEGKRQAHVSELKAIAGKGIVVRETGELYEGNGILSGMGKCVAQCPNLGGIPYAEEFVAVNDSGNLKIANFVTIEGGKIVPHLGRAVGAVRLYSQGNPVWNDEHAGMLCAVRQHDGRDKIAASVDLPEAGDRAGWVKAIKTLATKSKATEDDPVVVTVPRKG